MHIYEYGGEILVVDCGIGFPDETMPGVDYLVPDVSYLEDKVDRIRGIVITHGHEDHFGALPIILQKLPVPVYATKLVRGLIEVKLEANDMLRKTTLHTTDPDQSLRLGSFELEFFRVAHSVPDSVGLFIKTPLGNIIHAADYKFDWTPVDGRPTEVNKLARYGEAGVLCLLSDCLRVEKPGYTLSEKFIEEGLEREIRKAAGRIFITTFSSNISRIQQAANASQKFNRRITFASRTMETYFLMAQKLGYAHLSQKQFVPIKKANTISDKNLTIVGSGSQGEPEAALTRLAHGDHKYLEIKEGDTILFASDPIPGNEEGIRRNIDLLTSLGATVLYTDVMDDIHVSGHASREELKLMLGLVKPRFVVPISGTAIMSKLYQDLVVEMGWKKDDIFVLQSGQTLELGRDFARLGKKISVRNIMVDGLGVGDVGRIVLRDRKVLSEQGMLLAVVPVDATSGKISGKIEIISRGLVFEKNAQDILGRCQKIVEKVIARHEGRMKDMSFIREVIEEELEQYIYDKLGRTPMIIPVLIEV
jgi:ribonuclease J